MNISDYHLLKINELHRGIILMKKGKIFILLIILILLFTNNSFADSITESEQKIYLNIKLTRPIIDKQLINLKSDTGFSLYSIEDKDNPLFIIGNIKMKAKLSEIGNISLVDELGSLIFDLPMDGSILIASNDLENPIIYVENSRYRDYIRFYNQEDEIIVINHVDLDNYLYGVLALEMSPSFHFEALKAQAIASKNFALTSTKHDQYNYNLCDTTCCQVYGGFDRENPTTNLAVDETKNILAYYEGELITSYYHSTSSGYTEDSANVWSKEIPYLKSVEDHFSSDSPHSSWSISLNLQELRRKLEITEIHLGEIQEIYTLDVNSTGKVDKIKIVGKLGEVTISGAQFRSIIGNTNMKSAWFTIEDNQSNNNNQVYVIGGTTNRPKLIDINTAYKIDKYNRLPVIRGVATRALGSSESREIGGPRSIISGDEILIQGRGYGHGVGMSQRGAIKMAELGYSFDEILKYYYTGIDLMLNNELLQ